MVSFSNGGNIAALVAGLQKMPECLGFGLGLGLATLALRGFVRLGKVGVYTPWQLPVAVFVVVMLISVAAALLGILRVARTEPAVVFR